MKSRVEPVAGAYCRLLQEWSGNKVRKLELLLAEAVERGCDCVITVGGLQSNHARATAAAARSLGLDSHLVLRVEDRSLKPDCDRATLDRFVDMEGNLLVMQLSGAVIYPFSRAKFFEVGWRQIVKELEATLIAQGKKPLVIPVGGSCTKGSWGYLSAVEELRCQIEGDEWLPSHIDQIFMATGSGGTLAGVATAVALSKMQTQVTGCALHHSLGLGFDSVFAGTWSVTPSLRSTNTQVQLFSVSRIWLYLLLLYRCADEFLQDLGITDFTSRDIMEVRDAKGIGYSLNTPDELSTMAAVALHSGNISHNIKLAFNCRPTAAQV